MTGWRSTPMRAVVNDIDEGMTFIMDRAKAETGPRQNLAARSWTCSACGAPSQSVTRAGRVQL